MNTRSLNVLHNAGDKNVLAVANRVNLKLYAHHILVDKHRVFDFLRQNDFHIFFHVRFVERDNHILPAKNVARTEQNRVADALSRLESLFFGKNSKTARTIDVQLFAQIFKSFAVFCKVNSVGTCSQDFYSLVVQELCELYRRLSAKSDNNANRLFGINHAHHVFGSERLKIKAVRCVEIGRNGFGVVVNRNHVVAEPFQCPHALHACIVELDALPNADRTRAQNDNRAFFALFACLSALDKEIFCFIFAVVACVKIRSFCIKLACTRVNHFVAWVNVKNLLLCHLLISCYHNTSTFGYFGIIVSRVMSVISSNSDCAIIKKVCVSKRYFTYTP